jgi:transposase
MAKRHPPYAPEFRRQMVELVRAGRDPADLAREFEPSAQAIHTRRSIPGDPYQAIHNWVAQGDRQDGRREAKPAAEAGLSAAEREELTRLRGENKQLRVERDIRSRAAAWFARETSVVRSGSAGS